MLAQIQEPPVPEEYHVICSTRSELIYHLAQAAEKLGEVLDQVNQLQGTRDLTALSAAMFKARQLEQECEATWTELETHREEHGC